MLRAFMKHIRDLIRYVGYAHTVNDEDAYLNYLETQDSAHRF
jgi:hypothetical protein